MEIRVSNKDINDDILCIKVYDGKIESKTTLIVDPGFYVEMIVDGEPYDRYEYGKHLLSRGLKGKNVQVYAAKKMSSLIYFGRYEQNVYIINGISFVKINSLLRLRKIDEYNKAIIKDTDISSLYNDFIANLLEKIDIEQITNDKSNKKINDYIYDNIKEYIDNYGLTVESLRVNFFEKL